MTTFFTSLATVIMFPIAFLCVGFDVAKSFIEFHMEAKFKDKL